MQQLDLTTEPGKPWMATLKEALKSFEAANVRVTLDGRPVHSAYIALCRSQNGQSVPDPLDRPAVPASAEQRFATAGKTVLRRYDAAPKELNYPGMGDAEST